VTERWADSDAFSPQLPTLFLYDPF